MSRRSFASPDGPPPVGPYSPGVGAGDLVFLSGQVPFDKEGKIVGYTVLDQARRALENMKALLAADGLGMDAVVKTTIFLIAMDDFSAVNGVYAEFFTEPYPARSTVAVHELPKGVKVEIEAIAVRERVDAVARP